MLRTVFWILVAAVSLILISPVAIYYKLTLKHRPSDPIAPGVQWVVDTWGDLLLRIAGVNVVRTGEENIPDDPALFVGNHQGDFDIAIILCKIGKVKSIVAKNQTEKLPGVHIWMQNFDCIFMDRGNPRQSLACLNKAQELLENGRSVIIFPEGTRSRGPEMNEFKAGAFRCAVKAGVPIVPFVIDGSYRALEDKGHITPATVKLSILPSVSTADMEKGRTKFISQEIQQLIQDELYRMRGETPKEPKQWMTQESL